MKKIKLSVAALLIAGVGFAQTQCVGVTKSNNQCKNKTLDSTSLCYLHNPFYQSGGDETHEEVAVICQGTTKTGNSCKNKTKNYNGFCHLHQNQQ